jgi:hypothetical protein
MRLAALLCLVVCASAGAARATAAPLPPKEFRARANSLCAGYFKDVIAIGKRTRPHDLPSLARFQRQAHRRAIVFVGGLKMLTPPVAMAPTFRRFVALIVKSNAVDIPIAKAAERGDKAEVNRLIARESALDGPITKEARLLSLRVCAHPPS